MKSQHTDSCHAVCHAFDAIYCASTYCMLAEKSHTHTHMGHGSITRLGLPRAAPVGLKEKLVSPAELHLVNAARLNLLNKTSLNLGASRAPRSSMTPPLLLECLGLQFGRHSGHTENTQHTDATGAQAECEDQCQSMQLPKFSVPDC